MGTRAEIIKDLAAVMNKHNVEAGSGTPHYVLAGYLYECLYSWNNAICKKNLHERKRYLKIDEAFDVACIEKHKTDGYWHSCSGCHETVDGQETGDYPYSNLFKCYVGVGCHECGGLGVVWRPMTEDEANQMEIELEQSLKEAVIEGKSFLVTYENGRVKKINSVVKSGGNE